MLRGLNDNGQICIVRIVAFPIQVILLAPPCPAGQGKAWVSRRIWIWSMMSLLFLQKGIDMTQQIFPVCRGRGTW